MSATTAPPPGQPAGDPPASLLSGTGTSRTGDRLFAAATRGSSALVVVLVALTGAFLLWKALPALQKDDVNFLTSRVWQPAGEPPRFGIAALLWTTVLSAAFALLLAVPVSVGVALFLTHYAPRRLARPLAYLVDLLAAVPSIIYGLWGAYVLGPVIAGVDSPPRKALETVLGWVPLFEKTGVARGNVFLASVVLAIMILPIITAISREVFEQVPVANIEAALALGATRWETIRVSVLPFGRPGVISASMLGLGRALGETIAVTIILSQPSSLDRFKLSIFYGGETFASKIANNASEFSTPQKTGAYIAAGLVLFLVTFAVNAVARVFITRRGEV
ncbi:MAG: phosphate transport system permease protein [Actinomycetota bacterium]|jgi:phosphate transport system permease protein|nr:phosphate transport system permease protein [Actinomycetota bacterium]